MPDHSFQLKVQRAREHMNDFREAVQWWLESKPYRVADEIDTETDTKHFVVIAEQQPPERLALMYGDAIQNFRSALDYLVGDLARSNAGGHLMSRVESDLQFPITTRRSRLKGAVRGQARLGCVPLRAGALIQKSQPYRRGQDPSTHPLWVLHQLSNIDKHRRVTLMTSVIEGIDGGHFKAPGHINSATIGSGLGPFEDKAVVLSYSPANANVDVDIGAISIGVALGKGLPCTGEDPATVLHTVMKVTMEKIVEPLAAYI